MALQKDKTLNNGCVGNYHKIDEYAVQNGLLVFQILLFKDQAFRQSPGAEPMARIVHKMPAPTDADLDTKNPKKFAYAFLKGLPEYNGASDV